MKTNDVKEFSGLDWKALGYMMSIASVFFLGCASWYGPNVPVWHHPAVVAGCATSILGMGFRYRAHIHQKREIATATARATDAESANI